MFLGRDEQQSPEVFGQDAKIKSDTYLKTLQKLNNESVAFVCGGEKSDGSEVQGAYKLSEDFAKPYFQKYRT